MALNGQFPSTMLAYLGWPEADHLRLVPAAAASITRLAVKFEADHGKPLYITDAYRTLATQVSLKISKGVYAATPGTSNHGIGLAIDMASRINVDGSNEHLWMSAHGPEFGWINPAWAVDWNPYNGQHEPWHWEYHAELDQHSTPAAAPAAALPAPIIPTTQEDDMRILVQKDRGIWIVSPGYQRCLTAEEWGIISRRRDLIIWTFDVSDVGRREFDLVKAVFTQPTK